MRSEEASVESEGCDFAATRTRQPHARFTKRQANSVIENSRRREKVSELLRGVETIEQTAEASLQLVPQTSPDGGAGVDAESWAAEGSSDGGGQDDSVAFVCVAVEIGSRNF